MVTLWPPLCISGRVIDAATKKPLPKFHIWADLVCPEHDARLDLILSPSMTALPEVVVKGEGRYEATIRDMPGGERTAWHICVQARGYRMQLSPKFDFAGGPRTLDLELAPSRAACGIVRRPDGKPAAGAEVFIYTAPRVWTGENERVGIDFDFCISGATNSGEAKECTWLPIICDRTGADGKFELPVPLEPYALRVVHESGGAEATPRDLEARGEIVLQPWARVEGVLKGPPGQEAGKETVDLSPDRDEGSPHADKEDWRPSADWMAVGSPDRSGRFAFERVLPGRYKAEVMVHGPEQSPGAKAFVEWRPQIIEAVAGKTTRLEFLCKGRPVTGRAALPAVGSRKIAVAGGIAMLSFQRPLIPAAKGDAAKSSQARKNWEKQWLESEAGKAADRAGQNHAYVMAADGVFKVDRVAPGVYKLAVELYAGDFNPAESSLGDAAGWLVQEVAIPPGSPGDKPLDLGRLTVERVRVFRGDTAPDFAFKTADGRTHRLAEYRGRNVAVDFTPEWDGETWNCDADSARQQRLRQGGGGPLVWINLSSDPKPRPAVKMAQDAEFQYIQGAVAPSADVIKAYDFRQPSGPSLVLVGRDGTIVRK